MNEKKGQHLSKQRKKHKKNNNIVQKPINQIILTNRKISRRIIAENSQETHHQLPKFSFIITKSRE